MSATPPRSPLPAALRPVTVPASHVYRAIIAARNRRYDAGRGVQRVDRPVLSVGNITTGGTGKTPMVAWIARSLLRNLREPVIAMRGYKSRAGEVGDEEAEYRSILPDISVIADPNRVGALNAFLPRHPEVDCVLLDDGFQHRRLHRDLDLVLVDATADTLNDELLPAGHLREPLASLARADAVIVTRAQTIDDDLTQTIARWHGKPPIAWARHAWTQLWTYSGSPDVETVSWLRGKRVVTMLGIGNPRSVIAQVEAAGAEVIASIPASDHERYDRAKLAVARGLCQGCDGLLVTRKDWVKVAPIVQSTRGGAWSAPIIVPQVEIEFLAGESVLRDLLARAVPHGRRPLD